MKLFSSVTDPEIITILRAGGIGILRTDTLYGLVARAADESAVQRVYDLKHRDQSKSPIVLIADQQHTFDPIPLAAQSTVADSWPGKVSIILPSTAAPRWIRRHNNSVAYRQPDDESLRNLLHATGPLVAPSANPEGDPPAMNIAQAQAYFGDDVDFYVDGGPVEDQAPSRLLFVGSNGEIERLR